MRASRRIRPRKSHINRYNSMAYGVACVVHRDSLGACGIPILFSLARNDVTTSVAGDSNPSDVVLFSSRTRVIFTHFKLDKQKKSDSF